LCRSFSRNASNNFEFFYEAEEHPTLELVTEITDLNADPAKITLILDTFTRNIAKKAPLPSKAH